MNKMVGAAVAVLAALLGTSGCRLSGTEDMPLKVAVLPILDSLPFYVAEAEGYFTEESVSVELVTAGSAAERDQLLQADQADVVITDLVALQLANRDRRTLVGVRYAMVPSAEFPQFRILAAPGSAVASAKGLAGVPIGVSEGTVIEYVTDRLLTAEGLGPSQVETVAVPRIPDRMALLSSGELAAATLPEPLGSLVMQQGAKLVVDDTTHREYSCSVIAVRAELLEARPGAVRGLLRAIARASAEINADKDAWSGLLGEQQIVPPALGTEYRLPDYPGDGVPTATQASDVAAWLQAEGLLEDPPAYNEIVTADYLR